MAAPSALTRQLGGGQPGPVQQQLPVHAVATQVIPGFLQAADQGVLGVPGRGFALQLFGEGGGDPPAQDAASFQESLQLLGVADQDLAVGVDVGGEDVQGQVAQQEGPVRVAAQVDAARTLQLGQKVAVVQHRLLAGVAGVGGEEHFQAGLVQPNEGPRVDLADFPVLLVDLAGHEVEEDLPDVVAINDGLFVFVEDLQAEADGADALAVDGCVRGQVLLQEVAVDGGEWGNQAEGFRRFGLHFGGVIAQFGVEALRREADAALFHVQFNAGEVVAGLGVHVLVKRQVRQLRPERDVQGENGAKSRFGVGVGQDGHAGGPAAAG